MHSKMNTGYVSCNMKEIGQGFAEFKIILCWKLDTHFQSFTVHNVPEPMQQDNFQQSLIIKKEKRS